MLQAADSPSIFCFSLPLFIPDVHPMLALPPRLPLESTTKHSSVVKGPPPAPPTREKSRTPTCREDNARKYNMSACEF